jgi:hypothetical protein
MPGSRAIRGSVLEPLRVESEWRNAIQFNGAELRVSDLLGAPNQGSAGLTFYRNLRDKLGAGYPPQRR